jgi:hypothetical protein
MLRRMVRLRTLSPALLVLALLPATAVATPPASCPGAPITPTKVLTGTFGQAQKGSYVLMPFDVPRGTTQVRVQYCYDKPENTTSSSHTLDLGIYDSLRTGDRLWAGKEFRGWGGSSHPDVALSPGGFSTEAQYLSDPKGYLPGRTTRGFEPGAIPAGRWAVELGVGAVIPKDAGDATGEVGWRVAIELSSNPAYARHPYRPAKLRTKPVRTKAAWYQGDLHVHDEHSNLGAATIAESLGYAFRSRAKGGAGLDFTSLSDYVTDTAWGEIGRYQPQYPNNLVIPSAEVITYHGHLANQNAGGWVDYRTGPVLLRGASGALTTLRGKTPPRKVFDAIHRLGGFTVVNHPRIYPPATPALEAFCRGCYWNYTDAQTGFRSLDAIEVMNVAQAFDPAATETPNPFTAPAIAYWQHALATGAHIAAVGGSDTHNAGRTKGVTDAPLGTPTTVVYADELSADGIQRGVQAGHTFVKALGSGGPDLRLTARATSSTAPAAIMGDSVTGRKVVLTAEVLHAQGTVKRIIELQRNGKTVAAASAGGPRTMLRRTVTGAGRYGLVLVRGKVTEAIGSPIYVNEPRTPLHAGIAGTTRLHVRGGHTSLLCRATGTDVRRCRATLVVRVSRGVTKRTTAQGLVTGGRVVLTVGAPGGKRRAGTLRLTAIDRTGAAVTATRRVTVGR